MATNGVRALLQAQHIDYVDKRSQCNWLNILIMWTKEVNVTGNGGIISGRSETETFSRAIPWHVFKWFRKLVTCWSVRLRFSALFLTGSSRPQMFTQYAWYPDWQFFLPHWKKGIYNKWTVCRGTVINSYCRLCSFAAYVLPHKFTSFSIITLNSQCVMTTRTV